MIKVIVLNSIMGQWVSTDDIVKIDELSKYFNNFTKNFLIVENEIMKQ